MVIGIIGKKVVEDDAIRPGAAYWKSVAHHSPLWFAVKAKDFSQVMNESGQNEPVWMAIVADLLGSLQQMVELGKVGIGIAVIHQRVEIFQRFPDAHLPPVEP